MRFSTFWVRPEASHPFQSLGTRDGAAIIEHFEAASGRPCQSPRARQQVISALFDVIGTDGLLQPAMHYR